MATLRVTCETHGDIEITTADVKGLFFDYPNGALLSQYSFECPKHEDERKPVVKPAEPRVARLLIESGVEFETIKMPARTEVEKPFRTVEDVASLTLEINQLAEIAEPPIGSDSN